MGESGQYPKKQGLYDPIFEKGSCGVGFIADMYGRKTHDIVVDGLQILKNMSHRGATGADPETGDGAGIMTHIPHELFYQDLLIDGITLPEEGNYGVGMVFLPQDPNKRYYCEGVIERIIKEEKQDLIAWREVTVNDKACGRAAQGTQPVVQQFFVNNKMASKDSFERILYLIRKKIESILIDQDFYICSLSASVIVYKGQFLAYQIQGFYQELNDTRFKSAFATVHQRYSTNTFPSWSLAHPYRYIAHNGEINTIRGNVKWMQAREGEIVSSKFENRLNDLYPITDLENSDSANFDTVLEFLTLNGYSMTHALKMLMPEAWRYNHQMSPELKAFYEYHEGLIEPWDGPSTIVFSDGKQVGVALDRNGLRPARYMITDYGCVVVASEAGVLKLPEKNIIEKGKLGPGTIMSVDMVNHTIENDGDIKKMLSSTYDYAKWIKKQKIVLDDISCTVEHLHLDDHALLSKQKVFAYTEEELKRVIAPMATYGKEAMSSMGNDVPLAILSSKPQLLFNYFRQRFAQVTNPPIDPIREKKMMSLNQYLGRSGNVLLKLDGNQYRPFVELEQPILYEDKMHKIRTLKCDVLRSITIPILFDIDQENSLENALKTLINRVEESLSQGYRILILSDMNTDKYRGAIPSLLAVSAVHNHLIKRKLRTKADIIIETGEARDAAQMALLIGYGATAIYPYLAFESIRKLVEDQLYVKEKDLLTAHKNYVRSIGYGLRKITSKMGISTLRSFSGAQIFEALGLKESFVEKYFTHTTNKLSGIGVNEIEIETKRRHQNAYKELVNDHLALGSNIHWRKGEDKHLMTPDAIAKLQHACKTGDYKLYREYASLINNQSTALMTIRGLLNFKKSVSIDLADVEPVESIIKQFATGAMSFGSLSKEVHETLAQAMNAIGAKSNSGEGGEDASRYKNKGISKRSSIKQIAAGRFGVDTQYLVEADELQIKVAQGAKPGEGGHLPGSKVTEDIARVRHSLPGIDLISPPPHHDIYSIEDLEQLIFDLKNVNTKARVSVKLVSESGVGTIAAGVAKGSADMVLISGHDGGTGAAAITSVKTAGLPWELGLAETHQTLMLNNLRSRISVQVDGQLRTGRDVAIGALLGAEEFGFATAPLIVCGCILMRQCHKNTCPVGIATQDPELRKHFTGDPEHVINYFKFMAMELREIMASLGIKSLKDMVGRVDLLETTTHNNWKASQLDLSTLLYKPDLPARFGKKKEMDQLDHTKRVLDRKLIKITKDDVDQKTKGIYKQLITNTDRAVGAMLSGEIVKKHGKEGLEEDSIVIEFSGTAGQSFGAFLAPGLTMKLYGEANDYIGKSLSGGKIIISPHETSERLAEKNIIAGNTIMYGATSGEVYINGCVGERFAVRNSGAVAVVEGIGDHGCEYMTGGRIVVLGKFGHNFAAGMSGGIAYVLDEASLLNERCNQEMVDIETLSETDELNIKLMIMKHVLHTDSKKGQDILEHWSKYRHMFKRVISGQYKALLMKDEDVYTENLVG